MKIKQARELNNKLNEKIYLKNKVIRNEGIHDKRRDYVKDQYEATKGEAKR